MMDAGGPLPGSLPTGARTIFDEGIRIPPIKIFERGELQEDVLALILNNVRLPEMNRADLFAIVAGLPRGRAARDRALRALRQGDLPRRLQALLDRTYEAMRTLILLRSPRSRRRSRTTSTTTGSATGRSR